MGALSLNLGEGGGLGGRNLLSASLILPATTASPGASSGAQRVWP